jgi:TetR/AcrR family transcriptional regulator
MSMTRQIRRMSYLAERRLEEKERRRLEILEAAAEVAGVVGFEAMTMEQVARKARLSRALVYVYFKDKHDLLIGLCVRALEVLRERFTAAVAAEAQGYKQVEACGRAYVRFASDHPTLFDALAQVEAQTPIADDPSLDISLKAGDELQNILVEAIERGKADGSIRPDAGPSALLGLTLWGLMHGVLQLTQHKSGSLESAGVSQLELIEQGFVFAARAIASPSVLRP